MDALLGTGAQLPTDLDAAMIVANTIQGIVGEPPEPGEKSELGLEVSIKAIKASSNLVKAMSQMDVSTPDDLKAPIKSIAKTAGTIMQVLLGVGMQLPELSPNKTSNDTSEEGGPVDPCDLVPPIDKANADKPGAIEYDTDIGDDSKHNVASINVFLESIWYFIIKDSFLPPWLVGLSEVIMHYFRY